MKKLICLAALLSGSLVPMVPPAIAQVAHKPWHHVMVKPGPGQFFHRGRWYNHRYLHHGHWHYY